MYAEDVQEEALDQAQISTGQFRDALLAQATDLAAIYGNLTDDQKAEFDVVCGKFVALNQQAFQVLNPAYGSLFTAMRDLTGFSDWKIVLIFAGSQLVPNVEVPSADQSN